MVTTWTGHPQSDGSVCDITVVMLWLENDGATMYIQSADKTSKGDFEGFDLAPCRAALMVIDSVIGPYVGNCQVIYLVVVIGGYL